MARLRRQFGAGLVATSDAGYLVPAGVSTDADVFGELVAAAQEAAFADHGSERERICRAALALWSGPVAYEGVRDDLVAAERARLDELHRRARSDLASCLLDTPGEPASREEALALARGLISDNPLDEGAVVLAMRAAYSLHRQAESLGFFDELRRTLREELGVTPGPEVAQVHALVLGHDAALGVAARPARDRPVHPARSVPVPPTPTIGRDEAVADVLGALRAGHRLVTVTGPGGVGKSRLLAEVGAALATGRAGIPREVTHVSLAAATDADAASLAAGVAVRAGLPLDGPDPLESLVRALRHTEAVVLVDEAEWVLGPAATLVSAVLAGCPAVRLVITSRAPLGVLGERVQPLAPLGCADPAGELDAIRRSPSVRLLTARLSDRGAAPSADPRDWDAADLRVLAEVAQRLDGLPLALELVAGSGATTPIRDLADLVSRPLDLEADERDRTGRHQSLRRTVQWSVGRLSPPARTALRRVSVFAGPFTAAAARAVVGGPAAEVDAAVHELARENLLQVERTSTTMSFRMLRTVRDLGLEELARAGEEAPARAAHRRWFAGLWRDAPLSDALVEQVGRTYEDHLEALNSALAVGNSAAAADLTITLSRRWQFVETAEPGLHWTAVALALPDLAPRQRARLRVARAGFLQQAGWTAAAEVELFTDLDGDADWTCILHLVASITAYASGDFATAREHLERGTELAAARAPHLLPELIASRAATDAAAGRAEDAVRGAHDALARVGATSSAVHLVTVVPKVALALLDADRPDEALELLTTAARDASDRFGIRTTSTTAMNAGWAALGTGAPEVALTWFGEALTGPQAASAPGAVGEAAAGAGAAASALGSRTAAELLGLGTWLLDRHDQELPPALGRHVDTAVAATGRTEPPEDWTDDLACQRVSTLVGAGLADLHHADHRRGVNRPPTPR